MNSPTLLQLAADFIVGSFAAWIAMLPVVLLLIAVGAYVAWRRNREG